MLNSFCTHLQSFRDSTVTILMVFGLKRPHSLPYSQSLNLTPSQPNLQLLQRLPSMRDLILHIPRQHHSHHPQDTPPIYHRYRKPDDGDICIPSQPHPSQHTSSLRTQNTDPNLRLTNHISFHFHFPEQRPLLSSSRMSILTEITRSPCRH